MKVYVATYTHKHGTDMRVFETKESAENWKTEIAKRWWDDLPNKKYSMPDDPKEIADTYFEIMQESGGDEFFDVEECDVE